MFSKKPSGRRAAHRSASVNTSMRRHGLLTLAVTAAVAAILIPQASADEGTSNVTAQGSTTVQSAAGVYRLGIVEPRTAETASEGTSSDGASSTKGDDGGRNDGGQGESGDAGSDSGNDRKGSQDRNGNGEKDDGKAKDDDGDRTGKGGTGKQDSGSETSRDSSKGSDGREELAAPLEEMERTSPFGPRISPITGAPSEFHTGQDYAGVCGTSVKSSADGKITETGWHPYGGGLRITVSHGNGLETTYNHLSSIGVNVGDTVDTGDRIGRVGTTGASTGCHLHFEVVVNGDTVNPLNWL